MKPLRSSVPLAAMLVAALSAQSPQDRLPTEIGQTKFNSGANVVPVYEGWIRNPDGSFDMVFGYFNRNYQEELAIPVGADNMVEPGAPDRGQPTYFLPRRQARLFRVRVPKDWGTKELIWTLRVNGRAEKAYGELIPVEEINERIMMTGGNTVLDDDPNQPPSLTLPPSATATVAAPLSLTASVTDDGLPKAATSHASASDNRDDDRVRRDSAAAAQLERRSGPSARPHS